MHEQSLQESAFVKEVLEPSIPVLVYFGAPWCGPCRMAEPILKRFQTEWGNQFKLITINADENLKLSSQYRISTLPTILVFEGGKVICRLEGLYRRDDLWTELQKLIAKFSLAGSSLG